MITQISTKWNKVRLDAILNFYNGKSIKKSDYGGDYPVYGANGVIGKAGKFLYEDSLIIGRVGAYCGSVQYEKSKFWPSDNTIVVHAKPEKSDNTFLYFALTNKNLNNYAGGAAQPLVTQGGLKQLEIDIPDLSTQKQIAGVLSTYDDLIENNNRRIKILEDTAQKIYTEWFVNFRFPEYKKIKFIDSGTEFKKIPKGWVIKNIGDVCLRVQAGGTPRRGKIEYWENGQIPWYTTGELHDNFLFGAKEKITEQAINESSAKIFDKGTILMAIYGSPTVGRLGIITERSSSNQAALGLVPDQNKITQTYLFYVLYNLREKFNLESIGAAQQNISKVKVFETKCLLAEIKIIKLFDEIASPIFKTIEILQKRNITLSKARDSLVPQLVTGKLLLK